MVSLLSRTVYALNKRIIIEKCVPLQLISINLFHTNHQRLSNERKTGQRNVTLYFENLKEKGKEDFLDVVHEYVKISNTDRSYLEFISVALKYMEQFGVHKDLECYKELLNVMPKGRYIPTNAYQIMLIHYPKQQTAITDVLCQMEYNGVIPDQETEQILLNIFGKDGRPVQKCWRMMYWMPKFVNLNPWPVPKPIPKDPRVLAKLAVSKISSNDVLCNVTEFKTKEIEDSIDDTWIISAMSRTQSELLELHKIDEALFIEGPFNVWIADQSIDYFVLKGKPIKREVIEQDTDDIESIQIPHWRLKKRLMPVTIHEEADGVYFAMCSTGTSSKDSLLSWIRCLQRTNPALNKIPIIFKLKSSTDDLAQIEVNQSADSANKITQRQEQIVGGE